MTKIDKKPITEFTASQENVLVQSVYKMTLNEKRLLTLGMSKLNPKSMKKEKSDERPELTISVSEWLQVFPDDPKPFQTLARAADRVLGRQWRRKTSEGWRRGNWFSICDYNRDEGIVKLRFTPETAYWLFDFRGRFISANVDEIGRLHSFNQIRLYECFYQFSPASGGSGFMVIELDKLKEILRLENTYPLWNDFNRKVLIPSINTININTNTRVELTGTKKKKRSVYMLEFHIGEHRQQELDL